MVNTEQNKIRRKRITPTDMKNINDKASNYNDKNQDMDRTQTVRHKRVVDEKQISEDMDKTQIIRRRRVADEDDKSSENKISKNDEEQFNFEREIYYRRKKIKRKKRIALIKKLISVFLVVAVIGTVFSAGFILYATSGAPKITKELVYENYISSEVVESDQIPKDLKNAIVAMEDRRFYNHNGVDLKSLIRSFLNNLVTSTTQGGSTIDMQVSKNLLTSTDKTFKRKILDMYNAVQMNKIMTKDEILAAYLNNIYLGKSAYGVAKGAKVYFKKDVSELNLAQCAMLAGITNNPYRFTKHDQAKARQIRVLDDMLEQGYITQEQYKEAVDDPTLFASEID